MAAAPMSSLKLKLFSLKRMSGLLPRISSFLLAPLSAKGDCDNATGIITHYATGGNSKSFRYFIF
jgi:hypothetical protein